MTPIEAEHPHLVPLVLQSKKALQQGEQLCSRASSLSSSSAQCAIDVLALDAKVKWLSAAVIEQLKLAASVAKSIDKKRAHLQDQAKEWDILRTQRTEALDSVLESLGSQLVPHEFHSTSDNSSLFGSPQSDDGKEDIIESIPERSPSSTVRTAQLPSRPPVDRSLWKTLRDFVDERAIEDTLDTMDSDRNSLDDTLEATASCSETLLDAISTIQESLPEIVPLPSIDSTLSIQVEASADMARHLESLAAHYDQMASALKESEAGEEYAEDDLYAMNRDTNELPSIISELEASCNAIEASHDKLMAAQNDGKLHLTTYLDILNDLEELGDMMTQMLDRQLVIESRCVDTLNGLQEHLITIEVLQQRYTSYQLSYNKLLLEMGRRGQYREAAAVIVRRMIEQLAAMTEEERLLRADFNAEQGQYLPEDLCLAIPNMPTRWNVVPLREDDFEGSGYQEDQFMEVIPEVDQDLLAEARERIANVEIAMAGGSGSQSLRHY